MKFKRRIELERGLRSLDIAPLIDIIFQLLIFFMLTSSFIIQPGIKVKLPKATTSDAIEEENVIIVISREGIMYLKGSVVTFGELKSLLSKADVSKKPVVIKADRQASLGQVVRVWDLCRASGIQQVNIATLQE